MMELKAKKERKEAEKADSALEQLTNI